LDRYQNFPEPVLGVIASDVIQGLEYLTTLRVGPPNPAAALVLGNDHESVAPAALGRFSTGT
jgi:hypothetical protein